MEVLNSAYGVLTFRSTALILTVANFWWAHALVWLYHHHCVCQMLLCDSPELI